MYYTHEKNAVVAQLLKASCVKTVLDMACGTGAQVFYLNELGYKVIGADFSPGLIQLAQEKAKKQNLDIQFVDGDMRTLKLGGELEQKFDAVITIDNAVGHLIKNDFELAMRNIYTNLHDGGVYVFDILNLEAMTDDVIKADNERMTDKRITTDGSTIYNVRKSTVDRVNGHLTSENQLTIQTQEGEKKVQNTFTLQIYTMDDLKNMLLRNGFEVLEQYKADAYTFQKDEKMIWATAS